MLRGKGKIPLSGLCHWYSGSIINFIPSSTTIVNVSYVPGVMQNMGDTMMKILDMVTLLMVLQFRRCMLKKQLKM